jgi:uncharacterized protein
MKLAKIWANLSVKDIVRTADFYTKLGFKSNMSRDSTELTSFLFGEDNFVIHFFRQDRLEDAMNGKTADLKDGNEVMFSLSAEREEEVRAWADNAKEAGGTIFREAKPDENGYYYCGFADPDGHMFNVLLIKPAM